MTITLNGTTGIQNVLGSAASPAESNTTNSNTGVYFPTSTSVGFSANGAVALSVDASNNIFYTGGTERARVDSNGNVGINNASPSSSVKFTVKSTGTTGSSYVVNFTDSANASLLIIRSDGYTNTGTSSVSPYNFSTAGRIAYIDSAGGLGYLASVRAAKTNIESLGVTSWVYNLNPVQFNYRKKNESNQFTDDFDAEKHYGLIAEEVESINKELCFYDVDGTLRGVSYDKLTSVLLKAIQEQQALITQLTDRIAALEAK